MSGKQPGQDAGKSEAHIRAIAVALIVAAGFILAGCATRYGPGHGSSGGYSEIRLNPGLYRVAFQGNDATSTDRVNDYLIFALRSFDHQAWV